MPSKIYRGRYTTAVSEEEFAVFIIGLRINRLLTFWKWLPVFNAMSPMIRELYENRHLGFLHVEFFFSWRRITLIQYWQGFDHLVNYAHQEKHVTAWKAFNQKIKDNGSVGVFHETYQIKQGSFEAVYNHMPTIGLAKAFTHVPVSKQTTTAKKRMGFKT